jgi:hypothetical protein
MPATVVKLGPGELSVGATGTETDFTCQIIGARVEWSVDADDPVQVLCGESVPGDRIYSAELTGSLYQDLGLATGIVAYSWANPGAVVPFVFVPSTTAGQAVTGELIMDPISVGGDEAGANMTSDFAWAIVGEPILGAAPVTELAAAGRKGSKGEAVAVGA